MDTSRFVNDRELLLPVMLESFDPSTGAVVARTRRLVIDGRLGDQIYWSRDTDLRPAALEIQITPSGIEDFERSHNDMMIHPDLTTYNDRLDTLARNLPPTERTGRWCFPLTDELDFKSLPAFDTVEDASEQPS